MESRLRWLLIDSGLPRPEVKTNIHDGAGRFVGRADLFYPASNLVVEFDGGNHRERLVTDDRRQNSIVAAGFRILRFTTADLRNHPEAVVAQVSAEVSSSAWPGFSTSPRKHAESRVRFRPKPRKRAE